MLGPKGVPLTGGLTVLSEHSDEDSLLMSIYLYLSRLGIFPSRVDKMHMSTMFISNMHEFPWIRINSSLLITQIPLVISCPKPILGKLLSKNKPT